MLHVQRPEKSRINHQILSTIMNVLHMCITNHSSFSHLEFPLSKPCAEFSDALSCDGVALWLVLGHFILQGDETDSRALLLLQTEEFQDALVVVHVAVDENEQYLERER